MSYTLVALGNTGDKYTNTRHNLGRILLFSFAKKNSKEDWKKDKKANALTNTAIICDKKLKLILPETMMNNSGNSLLGLSGKAKLIKNLIVIHDEIDLPLGQIKISVGRGYGGHRGVDSIIKKIKSKDFIRIRVGITKTNPKGKIKKPIGNQKIIDFILGEFSKKEFSVIESIQEKIQDIIKTVICDGVAIAMNDFN